MQLEMNANVAYQGNASQADYAVGLQGEDKNPREEGKTAATGTQQDDGVSIKSNDTIKKAVNEINKRTNTEAVFGIHDETNRVMIKIVDKESKKVIKEYPPEKTLDMIAKVWEMAGILVDEKL